ncbi:hypothetical protein TNCV_1090831 [Trichonephila clavipes]|uniref:Uncharacterized protein n=1 Tax=Trichonephila clavipes TaxID=2585209 RepID=A0A8X6SP54_TRICX|nr:hypothetical protein TNCV_1090831 [Trichonephila clavipes]
MFSQEQRIVIDELYFAIKYHCCVINAFQQKYPGETAPNASVITVSVQRLHAEIVEVEIEVVSPSIVGGDRGRVAIYRPFGEFHRAKIALSPVWCSRPTTGVPLAHATMNFVGLDLTTSDRWHQKTTTELLVPFLVNTCNIERLI